MSRGSQTGSAQGAGGRGSGAHAGCEAGAVTTKGALLPVLAVASPLLLLATLSEAGWALALYAALAAGFPVALAALGAVRRGRLGPLAGAFAALAVLLAAGLGALLALRGHGTGGPWIGGLPPAAAVQLYGLGLAPLALVVLAYALTFERRGVTEEDLKRIRGERVRGERERAARLRHERLGEGEAAGTQGEER